MAQTYRDPLAHQRMAAGTCPECGKPAEQHVNDVRFWIPRDCGLLPRGVQERIDQYRTDATEGVQHDVR